MSSVGKAITLPGGSGVQMLLFRREAELSALPHAWPVEITADSRYRLYVNGQRVGDGPCRPSPGLRYSDKRDIASYLTEGINVLTVWLAYYPPDAASNADYAGGPVAVLTGATPFFRLDDPQGIWSTGEQWKVCSATGYTFTHIVSQLSFMERIDLSAFPKELYTPGYDDSGWTTATCLPADTDSFACVPRPIPFPLEREGRFYRGVRNGGGFDWNSFLGEGVTLPPNTDVWVELDAGMHVTALPRLTVEGGRGSRLTITYAESYKQAAPDGKLYKEQRDEAECRAVLDGFADCVIADGTRREWIPFWYRTFRFVRLHIRTADQSLRLETPQFVTTGYPLDTVANFCCDREAYDTIWKVSCRTLQNCMYETYMDCPYYEQLQYVMDTVLQMQYASKLTHDTRLTKRAMADFFRSQLPNGLLPSHAPTKLPTTIPGFSLFAVYMLDLYHRRFADTDTVREYLPQVERILAAFATSLDDRGMVSMPNLWCFTDWVAGWEGGSPLTDPNNSHVIYTLMYAAALRCASRLYAVDKQADKAEEMYTRAEALSAHMRRVARDTDGLFWDELPANRKSRHAQLWAVLSETVVGEEATDLMRCALADDHLADVSYCMLWLWLRAMEKTGLYHLTEPVWDRYLALLSLGLTTWPEDDLGARSDCHAWSAVALYEFTAHGLGVREIEDGNRLLICPDMLWLRRCEGSVATRFGTVWVAWSQTEEEFYLSVEATRKTPLCIQLPNGQVKSVTAEKATYSIHLIE